MNGDPTLAAIEQRMQRVLNMDGHPSAQVRQDARRLAHDVPYLLDRLRAVTAERDQWQREWAERGEVIGMANRTSVRRGHERDEARRQVAAVRALHHQAPYALSNPDPDPFCQECDDGYPCPTIRALDSAQHQDTPPPRTAYGLTSPDPATLGPVADLKLTPDTPTSHDHMDDEACGCGVPATPQDTPDDSEWQALADAWTPVARAAAADNIRSALRLKDSPLVRARLDYLVTPQDRRP